MREILRNAQNDGVEVSARKLRNVLRKSSLTVDKKICYDKINHVEKIVERR